VHADIALCASYRKCWTAEFIEACEAQRASDRYINCIKAAIPLPLQDLVVDLRDRYINCIKAAIPLPLQDLVVDLRERLRAVWRDLRDYLSCMDGLASQAKHRAGPSPFAA